MGNENGMQIFFTLKVVRALGLEQNLAEAKCSSFEYAYREQRKISKWP